jgi:hypothetical protein
VSNPLAIAAVTATFGRLIRNVSLSGITFSMLPPDIARTTNAARQLNLYLYRVTPNLAYRNADLPTRGSSGELANQPVLALNLHYLMTAWGAADDNIDGHHLLAQAMSLINDRPVLTRASIAAAMAAEAAAHADLAAADLAEQVEHVKLTLDTLSYEDLFKLWSAFQTGYRLSVAYEASLVLIERRAPRRSMPPPREAALIAMPLSRPRIDSVEPPEATAGSTVALVGGDLAAATTNVRIDGALVAPDDVAPERVTVTLPGTLRAGIHALSVVQNVDFDGTGVPLFESAVAPLVLIPQVTGPIPSVAAGADISVPVAPPVEQRQDAVVLVGNSAIPVPPRTTAAALSTLKVKLPPAVTAGSHLVRVRVEGAESRLATTSGAYSGPKVTVT